MLIYTPQITTRVQYVTHLIFETVSKIEVNLTCDLDTFELHEGPKINYSSQRINDELWIKPFGLLNDKGIENQDIELKNWNNLPIFFKTTDELIPFDVFSATFYLVSRYEEYLPHIKDHYNRFTASQSLAHKHHFLERPLVNLWIKEFQKIIEKKFDEFTFPVQVFKYTSTIDVDNAYYFLEKGVVRTLASFAKEIFQNDKDQLYFRKDVLLGKQADPYDTFDYQIKINQQFDVDVIYFILLADYGTNDKNCSVHSRKFQLLIKHLSDYSKVGIHPSFSSNLSHDKLQMEVKRLEKIIKQEVKLSRQHFLKLDIPKTYRNLIELSIEHDYTMGYASHAGFRASICTPYYFYDLENESSTSLMIHPFAVMDATYRYYLMLSPDESLKHIEKIINEIKAVDGHFISVWHNETWSDYQQWQGWKTVYERMLEIVRH